LNPGGSNRANIHRHGVANGRETNGQYIAESLFQSMLQGLAKYRSLLSRGYFPDVLVGQVTNPGHLEKCLCYMDKVVPIALIVADAMQRSEGKLPDGRWDRKYVSELENSLQQLIRDDIPNIVEDFHSERVVWKVRRRKSVGNMTFTDKPDKKGKCIGDEPDWHKRKRHKAAEKLKKARDRAKERQAKDEANGIRVTRKPVSRARRNPRRLSRSLGLPIQKPRDGSAAQPIGRTMPQKRRLKVKVKNASVLNSTPDQLDVPECAVEVIQAKGSSANEKARLRPLVWPTARRRLPGLDSS